jgi:hypothetical protein
LADGLSLLLGNLLQPGLNDLVPTERKLVNTSDETLVDDQGRHAEPVSACAFNAAAANAVRQEVVSDTEQPCSRGTSGRVKARAAFQSTCKRLGSQIHRELAVVQGSAKEPNDRRLMAYIKRAESLRISIGLNEQALVR